MSTTEYSREEIIAANPLSAYCQRQGWQLKKDGSRWKCLCPLHNESSLSFTIDSGKNLWKCFGCDTGGSIIDLNAKLEGLSIGGAMRDLMPRGPGNGSNGSTSDTTAPLGKKRTSTPKPPSGGTQLKKDQTPYREVCAYDYQDATGEVVFQSPVCPGSSQTVNRAHAPARDRRNRFR